MFGESAGTSAGFDAKTDTAQLTATRNLMRFIWLAFTFRELGDDVEGGKRLAAVACERSRDVEALAALSDDEVDATKDAVSRAAIRVETARISGDHLVSRTSALSVLFVWVLVALLSVYALPQVRPRNLEASIVFVAALGAGVLGTVLLLFSLPTSLGTVATSPQLQRVKLLLAILPDWLLFLVVCWLYVSLAWRALETARSAGSGGWIWEVAFAGVVTPFSAFFAVLIVAVVVGISEGRRRGLRARYVVNDMLVLTILELIGQAQRTIDQWYEPKSRQLLVGGLEAAARRIEVHFSRAARTVHGPSAAQQVREQGRRIAAALRRYEQYIALAAGPSDVTKVRDALCSGLVAATQGDWLSLTHVDPGSAVRSLLRRLWPRLAAFLVFASASVLLLWLSHGQPWRGGAVLAATTLGLSAVLSITSPSDDVTRRVQEAVDKALKDLWRP